MDKANLKLNLEQIYKKSKTGNKNIQGQTRLVNLQYNLYNTIYERI